MSLPVVAACHKRIHTNNALFSSICSVDYAMTILCKLYGDFLTRLTSCWGTMKTISDVNSRRMS